MRSAGDSERSARQRGPRDRFRTASDAASDRALADRLEAAPGALSNAEVERILGRAAEIDSGLDDDLAIDAATLIRAAREVGLSESSVRRALAEERVIEPAPHGFLARLLVGDQVVESDLIESESVAVSEILDSWMRTSEGLRPARAEDNTVKWEPDRSWATRVRLSINRETNGIRLDRSLPVSHSIVEVGPEETLVAVQTDTELLRKGASAGMIATGVVGAAAAAPFLARSDGVGETVAVLLSTGLGVSGIGSAIVFATRLHVRRLRAAMRRPLDAVARAEPVRGPANLVDTVLDAAQTLRRRRRQDS